MSKGIEYNMNIRLCTIDTEYIEYLQNTCNIPHVLDNKEESVHGRRYLGVVLQIEHYKYYVPLSSPKNNDFINSQEEYSCFYKQ